MKRALFFFEALMFLGLAHAKTVVLSPADGGDRIADAIQNAADGDTVLLKQGVYKVNLRFARVHGGVDRPVVIMGECRDSTIIDGGAPEPDDKLANYAFEIDSSSWLNIENLSVRNSWCDAIKVSESSYISVRNLNVVGGRRLLFATGRGSHHFLVENCYWEQGEKVWTKEPPYTWEELHHGKYRCYNGSIFQGRRISGSFVIRHNYIKNVYNGIRLSVMEGVEDDTLACSNGIIYDNVIENSADNAFEPEVYCKNLYFFHNKMINSHAFISFTEVGGGPMYFFGNTGVKKTDCDDGWTIFKISGGARPFTRPVYIFNNSWQVDSPIYGKDNDPFWENDHVYHFNNAYCVTKGDTVGFSRFGTDNRFGNDCCNLPLPARVAHGLEWQDITKNPEFVDGASGNFHLRDGSPCRDAGIRPFGLAIGKRRDKVDIGAYDDGELVDGPVFRYMELGPEMPASEKPVIVKCEVGDTLVRLWLSYPLKAETVDAGAFEYCVGGVRRKFASAWLSADGCRIDLRPVARITRNVIGLVLVKAPAGVNGEPMTLWAAPRECSTMSVVDEAQVLGRCLGEKLAGSVSFRMDRDTVRSNGGLLRLFPGVKRKGLVAASMTIKSESKRKLSLGYSLRGKASLFVNGKRFGAGQGQTVEFKEYAYGRYSFPYVAGITLDEGDNELSVVYDAGDSLFRFVCAVLDANGMVDPECRTGNGRGYDSDWTLKELNGNVVGYQRPATALYFNNSKADKRKFSAEWNYSDCNTVLGMMSVFDKSQNGSLRVFVDNFFSCFLDSYQTTRAQYLDSCVMRGACYKAHRNSMLDDSGGCAVALAQYCKYRDSKKAIHVLLTFLHQVLDEQERLPDGTLCRPEPVDSTVWADDMFMSVPFVARMGVLLCDTALFREALLMAAKIDACLADKATGIYVHGYNKHLFKSHAVSWGRANGWALWALSEVLSFVPSTTPGYGKVRQTFTDRLNAILRFQDDAGMFHQIIDDPATYAETSATAMIAIAMSRALRRGWLPGCRRLNLLRAWNAVVEKINRHFDVEGICASTELLDDVEYYRNRPTSVSDPRGMGAVLTLCAEMMEPILSL